MRIKWYHLRLNFNVIYWRSRNLYGSSVEDSWYLEDVTTKEQGQMLKLAPWDGQGIGVFYDVMLTSQHLRIPCFPPPIFLRKREFLYGIIQWKRDNSLEASL